MVANYIAISKAMAIKYILIPVLQVVHYIYLFQPINHFSNLLYILVQLPFQR